MVELRLSAHLSTIIRRIKKLPALSPEPETPQPSLPASLNLEPQALRSKPYITLSSFHFLFHYPYITPIILFLLYNLYPPPLSTPAKCNTSLAGDWFQEDLALFFNGHHLCPFSTNTVLTTNTIQMSPSFGWSWQE